MRFLFQDVADNQIDSGDLMECLIQNKHQKDMNEKCAIGVTHFPLVSDTPQKLLVLTAWLVTESLPLLEHQGTPCGKQFFSKYMSHFDLSSVNVVLICDGQTLR